MPTRGYRPDVRVMKVGISKTSVFVQEVLFHKFSDGEVWFLGMLAVRGCSSAIFLHFDNIFRIILEIDIILFIIV